MEIMGLSDLTWISTIAFIACLAFGLYMIKTGKPGIVRGIKDTANYRNKEKYSVEGGKLLLFLAGGCLIMTVVSFVNVVVSNILGLLALCVFGYFWKKMSDEYGPV